MLWYWLFEILCTCVVLYCVIMFLIFHFHDFGVSSRNVFDDTFVFCWFGVLVMELLVILIMVLLYFCSTNNQATIGICGISGVANEMSATVSSRRPSSFRLIGVHPIEIEVNRPWGWAALSQTDLTVSHSQLYSIHSNSLIAGLRRSLAMMRGRSNPLKGIQNKLAEQRNSQPDLPRPPWSPLTSPSLSRN